FVLSACLVMFFAGFRSAEGGRLRTAAALCGAAALGVLAMSKTSYLITPLALLLVADANRIVHRRLPVLAAALLLSPSLTYLAFGQSVATLPQFIALQGEMVFGYAEAMSLRGSELELAAFLLLSGLLGVLVLLNERARAAAGASPVAAVLLVAGFTGAWLLAF